MMSIIKCSRSKKNTLELHKHSFKKFIKCPAKWTLSRWRPRIPLIPGALCLGNFAELVFAE